MEDGQQFQQTLEIVQFYHAIQSLSHDPFRFSEIRNTLVRSLEQLLGSEALDFVQFTYNMDDREAERRLLPMAAERGVAVIVNRPFQRGGLFDRVRGRPVPGWAAEFDCANWAQFFLKFAVSHPAVTCAIPATTKPAHLRENMGALHGTLPDGRQRQRMIDYVASI